MSSIVGERLKISIFGQSHGEAVGVVIEGLPPGERIDTVELAAFMSRRAPGGALSTSRREADIPEIVSGLYNQMTCGAPLCVIIHNSDARSGDYSRIADRPRPGHADFTALHRYGGYADPRGGGHFSGRLTAPLCSAGGIIMQILERRGVYIGAHVYSVAGIFDEGFDSVNITAEGIKKVTAKPFPAIDDGKARLMTEAVLNAKEGGDSVGGIVECAVAGMPAGAGSPMFLGVENRIATAVFGIPAVKGIEFGAGFASAGMRGSQNNDEFVSRAGGIRTATNNCGGILGGITTGMPIVFRAAFKPTPSIALEQNTVNTATGQPERIAVSGRHDPCVAIRAVPCVESAAAIVMLDMLVEMYGYGANSGGNK